VPIPRTICSTVRIEQREAFRTLVDNWLAATSDRPPDTIDECPHPDIIEPG
jgi:hypothetical protein